MSSTWSQLEQLLTCCICLDRYRNPRLLPCQHSFCSEPCLDGLVDYARRQIKCPECRAEHRLPYSGEPNFPANFTLMRFLELYQKVTGEEPEILPSMLERCAVCSEKAELRSCAHCEKRVCQECRAAHAAILRRELQRLNAQIRRALSRLQEELAQLGKCEGKLRASCESTRTQLNQLAEQLVTVVQEKRSQLLRELDEFQLQEQCSLTKLREIIGEEYESLLSNCELIERHVLELSPEGKDGKDVKEPKDIRDAKDTLSKLSKDPLTDSDISSSQDSGVQTDWTDQELIECRDIYLRTLEFLRHFETVDSLEYARKALKLELHAELDLLRKNVANFAMLRLQLVASDCLQAHMTGAEQAALVMASTPSGIVGPAGLTIPGSGSLVPGTTGPVGSSLLMRSQSDHRLAAQFAKKEAAAAAAAVGSTGGVPGSRYGNFGVYDGSISSEYSPAHYHPASANVPGAVPGSGSSFAFKSRFMREKGAEIGLYEDDGSDFGGPSGGRVRFDEHPTLQTLATSVQARLFESKQAPRAPLSFIVKLSESLHLAERLDEQKRRQLKMEKDALTDQTGSGQSGNNNSTGNVGSSANVNSSAQPLSRPGLNATQQPVSGLGGELPQQPLVARNRMASRQMSEDEIEKQKKLNKQLEQQQQQQPQQQATLLQHPPNPVATVTQVGGRQLTSNSSVGVCGNLDRETGTNLGNLTSVAPNVTSTLQPVGIRRQEQQQLKKPLPSSQPEPEDEEDDEEEDEEEDEEDEEDEEEDEDASHTQQQQRVQHTDRRLVRRQPVATKQSINTPTTSSGRRLTLDRQSLQEQQSKDSSDADIGENRRYQYRTRLPPRLRSPSTEELFAAVSALDSNEDHSRRIVRPNALTSSSSYNTVEILDESLSTIESTSPRSILLKHKSVEQPRNKKVDTVRKTSTTSLSLDVPGAARRARFADITLQKRSANNSVDSEDASFLTARQSQKASSHRSVSSENSSTDDFSHSENEENEPSAQTSSNANSLQALELQHQRQMYLCKGTIRRQFGRRGDKPGEFTWPRDVAIVNSRRLTSVPDHYRIAVADSLKCQLFNAFGSFLFQFSGGTNAQPLQFGELASLVASDDDERLIISDREKHCIRLFDYQGNLLREFGVLGDEPGQLRQPCGVAYESTEREIYVCDQGNKRLQVFGVEGNFRRMLAQTSSTASNGKANRASSSINNTVVLSATSSPYFVCVHQDLLMFSDTAQHVVLLLNWKSGRRVLTLGGEGTSIGRFKFPRGVAIDSNGFLLVADAGNNRIQIFNPDGQFLKSFGKWGSGDGEFKGLEGLAVTGSSVCVCDRENNRIQVF